MNASKMMHLNNFVKVSEFLTQAILLEVSSCPKPGLVTKKDNGSHSDMSIITFVMSSAIVSKAFDKFYTFGTNFIGEEKELFYAIRKIGVEEERKMFEATKNINTQKGILFAGGILAAACGYLINKDVRTLERLRKTIILMTQDLVDEELKAKDVNYQISAGKKLYEKYGITGIREEVSSGFPSVFNYGLPAMEEAFSKGASINDAIIHTLISLMMNVDDTNVVWRSNIEMLEIVKKQACNIIEQGSVFSMDGKASIKKAEEFFVKRRISPGGSADLVSITIAFYLLKYKQFPCAII